MEAISSSLILRLLGGMSSGGRGIKFWGRKSRSKKDGDGELYTYL